MTSHGPVATGAKDPKGKKKQQPKTRHGPFPPSRLWKTAPASFMLAVAGASYRSVTQAAHMPSKIQLKAAVQPVIHYGGLSLSENRRAARSAENSILFMTRRRSGVASSGFPTQETVNSVSFRDLFRPVCRRDGVLVQSHQPRPLLCRRCTESPSVCL